MSYSKTIVCLANSRKMNGRCIAGLEYDIEQRKPGPWIRPVSHAERGQITEEDRLADGSLPQLLDLITVPLERAKPEKYQTENHVIARGTPWRRVGKLAYADLVDGMDSCDEPLWFSGSSSWEGLNDRIPESSFSNVDSSLRLVAPGKVRLECHKEGESFGSGRMAVRALFTLSGQSYKLKVTDFEIECSMEIGDTMELRKGEVLLCVSLGEPYNGFAYKLVAAVIRK